jgi:sigma54-dependent transcription regulator
MLSHNEFLVICWILIVGVYYFGKKFADNNPEIKDAAKTAGTAKLIDLIRRWLK